MKKQYIKTIIHKFQHYQFEMEIPHNDSIEEHKSQDSEKE